MPVLTPSPWEVALRTLFPKPEPYLNDPVGWINDVLGEETWSKQEEIARSVAANDRVAVEAGHSVGKTWLCSRLVLWFVSVHPVGTATVITTAPTDDQVKTVMWQEIMAAHEAAGLPGKITLDAKWHMGANDKQLVAFGRKPADHRSSAFQGKHNQNILVIIDEACGVVFPIWDQLSSVASNEGGGAHMLAVGNPTDPASHFANVCKPGSGWVQHKISVFDSPLVTGEEASDKMRKSLSGWGYINRCKKDYGESSPLYAARVLGEFPDVSDDTLIQPKWIEAAQLRDLPRDHKPKLGIDIARFGEDETTIYRREGGWVRLERAHSKADTMTTAGHIAKIFMDVNAEKDVRELTSAGLDEVGVGAGVLDRLSEQGFDVQGLNGGNKPNDPERFTNARAEWYWNLREAFEQGEIDIDPNDDQLAAQLGAIKWTVDSRGRVKIESKDDMRKRGLPSPDRADSVVYSWATRGTALIDVSAHAGKTITGDLMSMGW